MKIKYVGCATTGVPKHIGYSKLTGFARIFIIIRKVNKGSVNSKNINKNLFSIEEEASQDGKILVNQKQSQHH